MHDTEIIQLIEDTLHTISEILESADQDYVLEIDLIDGTLAISFQDGTQYLINKHEASKQIWVSSPLSGGTHFSYDEESDSWVNSSNDDLFEMLAEEFKELADLNLEF